jgi:arabinofuranosyltransferase
MQGLRYMADSLQADPITLALLGSGLLLALLAKDRRNLMIAIGAGLYIAYVIWIGGDFMSGRFLAAPYLCSLLILALFDLSRLPKYGLGLLFGMILLLGLLSPTPTLNFWEVDLTAKERSAMVNDQKISNERRYYAWSTGLLRINRQSSRPAHPYAEDGVAARQAGPAVTRRITVGMFGYYAGPQVHVVDELALGDALLARLPARRVDQWRIGHFQRTLPAGYLESLRSRSNQLADANLAKYYDALLLVIKGELVDPQRLAAIWKLNSGQYDWLIDFDAYRYPKLVLVRLYQLDQPETQGSAWDAAGNFIFGESGIEIELDQRSQSKQIELSLDGDNAYQVVYLDETQELARQRLAAQSNQSGMQTTCLETPPQASQAGFTRLRIFATHGDDRYSLGNLRLEPCSEP